MGDLIRAETFRFRKNIRGFLLVCFFALATTFMFGNDEGYALDRECVGMTGLMGSMLAGMAMLITVCDAYTQRVQYYEIMAGFRPSRIILSRVAVYLPAGIAAYFIPYAVMHIIHDGSIEMTKALFFMFILFVRIALETFFLSPLFKNWTTLMPFVYILPAMFRPMIEEAFGSPEMFDRSVLGLSSAGQMMQLGGEITTALVAKIIISSVLFCIFCYIIGYLILKRKFSLEVKLTSAYG